MFKINIVVSLIISLLAFTASSWAAYTSCGTLCYQADSCSSTDVQSAMTAATASGSEVRIPACSGGTAWSAQVTWTAPSNAVLRGAGTTDTGGGDVTVIQDNYGTNAPILSISVSATGTFRMTGITFKGGTGAAKDVGMLIIGGPGTVRLDHLHLNSQSYSPQHNTKVLWVGDRIYGVMDHSIIDLYSTSTIITANGSGTDGKGNATWAADTNFGSADFFFVEDCIINGTASTHDTRLTDVYSAGRFVYRFNDLVASVGHEIHATGHAGDDRGARAVEGYGNLFSEEVGQSEPNYVMSDLSSGCALIWGNEAPAVFKNVIVFNVTRKNNDTYSQSSPPAGWGYCGTDFTGTGSAWDESSSSGTGYACIDQPGRGKGDLLTGSFPNKINSTTGTVHWPHQALEPMYIWKNTASVAPGWGGNWYSNNSSTASGARVVADQDYYGQTSTQTAQTSSSSPFDGTKDGSGIGWGTLANRPTTCTTGVAYWATDQGSWNTSSSNSYGVQQNGADGVLYVCATSPANTWTEYYTPYTYPHPLQGETNPTITGVSITGVQIQ